MLACAGPDVPPIVEVARNLRISADTVRKWRRRFLLKPHRTDTFKLSTDPLSVEKVYDVVGLYFKPSEGEVVLSVDEKS